jgi:hypothetical protein
MLRRLRGVTRLPSSSPQTDLERTYAVAEPIRWSRSSRWTRPWWTERPAGDPVFRHPRTVVEDVLIAAADGALDLVKGQGKNKTVRAVAEVAQVVGGR